MTVSMAPQPGLRERLAVYAITDARPQAALMPVLDAAIQGGVTAVQLRRKADSGREFVRIGRAVRQLTRERGVLLVVNDRVDIAWLVEADGVHLGQDDMACEDARRLLPGKIIGVSVRSVPDALAAQRAGADYLGVGAMFATATKPGARHIGPPGLRRIAQAVTVPVVGIGGIHPGNAAVVVAAGADGVAVVSAVMDAEDPGEAARALCRNIQRARPR